MVEHHDAVITEEMMRGLRGRVGIEIPWQGWYEFAAIDTIRHFARGYGDINPLYRDPEYAKKTRWGGPIAPPMFMEQLGYSDKKDLTKEERERGKGGGLPGIHAFDSGRDLDFLQVIRPGDRLTSRAGVSGFEEKKSRFAGRAIHETSENVYRNQRGEIVGVGRVLIIRVERAAGRETAKYQRTVQHYTPEEMKAIDADYEREEIRGAKPRYWEDVNVGDELTPVVKGPYTAISTIAYLSGSGMGGAPLLCSHSEAYRDRKRHPAAWDWSQYGFPDTPARVHWDHDYARQIGLPLFYDIGVERIAWLSHVVTNWMGDDGFLRKLSGQWRLFNYYGDTTWIKGKVTSKYVKDSEHLVDIELSCVNQRGEINAPGHATVILLSRVHGPVVLPSKLDRPITFG